MSQYWSDIAIGIVALMVSVTILIALPFDVPDTGWQTLSNMESAAFFPMLAAILIGLSGGGLLISTLLQPGQRDHGEKLTIGKGPLLMLALLVAYIPLITWLGMVAASTALLLVLPTVFGLFDWRWIVVMALVLPLAIYALFSGVLKVIFPAGGLF